MTAKAIEVFTAYECTEGCGISREHAGAGCEKCKSCGELGWVQDDKGRYRCHSCNKLVKKSWDYSCKICDGEYEQVFEALAIKAYECECGELVEYNGEATSDHEETWMHKDYLEKLGQLQPIN